jgi:hypothetical protein
MFYVVRLDDSLAGIAKRFRSTIETIMEANIIYNPNFIQQPFFSSTGLHTR